MKRRRLIAIGSSIFGVSINGCVATERTSRETPCGEETGDGNNTDEGHPMNNSESSEEVVIEGTYDHEIVKNFETEVGAEIYMYVHTISGISTQVQLLDQQGHQVKGILGDEIDGTHTAEKEKYTIKTREIRGTPELDHNSSKNNTHTHTEGCQEESEWKYRLKVSLRK